MRPYFRARRSFGLAVFLLLLVGAGPAAAGELGADQLDALMQDALKAWQVPGAAIAIVRTDKVVAVRGWGRRDLTGGTPVTADTVFPLASCTKAFTATALAQLVGAGKLDWDDPVRKHVPSFRLRDPLADRDVRLRDLLCHRTGVGSHDFLWYRASWSQAEMVRRIGLVPPDRPFRTGFAYQSIMYVALGRAVESAGGRPWDTAVRAGLLKPLGMTNTHFTTADARKATELARPHRRGPDGQVVAIPEYVMNEPNPAGSIYSSARDLSRWLQFQLGDGAFRGTRLVPAAAVAETHAPQAIIRLEGLARAMNPDTKQMSYGMAWVVQDYRGHLMLSHGGAIDGFRAHLTLLPEDGWGLAVLTNLHGTRMNQAVSNQLVDRLLGLPARDWNAYFGAVAEQEEKTRKAADREREQSRRPDQPPTLALTAYADTYTDPAYGEAKVVAEKDGLVWQWSHFRCRLRHHAGDAFVADDEALGRPLVRFRVTSTASTALEALGVTFQRSAPR